MQQLPRLPLPFLPVAATALFLVVLTVSAVEAVGKPNVVLVMTDDQGYGDIHAHGNAWLRTPNMDRLHSQSVRFRDFHVDPTCSPTRSALLSGRYSTRTGVWHTIMGRSLMDTHELTIAEALKSGGYRTGMYGKWHLGENYPLRPQDQGFDDVVYHGGGGVGQGSDWWGNDYFDDTYFRDGVPEKFEGYCTDVWFAEAMKFIERSKEGPFFCYLATNAPHGPWLVDPRWSEPYVRDGVDEDQALFYGMIENIDWNLGKLMAQLDQLGLAEDTILIFMTDNGTAGGPDAGMRGHKGSEYDGGHRVPFFIRWPGGGVGGSEPGSGGDLDDLCAHIDVLPTLLELCGVARPQGPPLDGISLAPRLKDPSTLLPERTLLVHSQRIPYPEKWRKCAVMTERWRLVNGKELYDIQADPAQRRDLAGVHADVVETLKETYEKWWEGLSVVFDKSVHIGIGSEKENPTQLHPHDWQVESARFSPWNQSHVRRGHLGQGKWFIDVLRPGRYEIELRRWPRHLDQGLEAKHARVKIGGLSTERPVWPEETKATFTVGLDKGKMTLQTWLTLEDGRTRGAYFVYVTRLPDGAARTRRRAF